MAVKLWAVKGKSIRTENVACARLADANAYADLYLSKQSLFKLMLAEIDIAVYAS